MTKKSSPIPAGSWRLARGVQRPHRVDRRARAPAPDLRGFRPGFEQVAAEAVRIESRTNLLFSFEKMALRDAVRTRAGARLFAEGLYELPRSEIYAGVIRLASLVRRDLHDLRPRDMIDIQSFLWVQGSDEYAEGPRAAE